MRSRAHLGCWLVAFACNGLGCGGNRAATTSAPSAIVLPAPPAQRAAANGAPALNSTAASVAPTAEAMDGAEQNQTIALAGVSLTLRSIGTSYIELAAVDAEKGKWSKIEVQRRMPADSAWKPQLDTLQKPKAGPVAVPLLQRGAPEIAAAERAALVRHGHAAQPGATYNYRARLAGSGAWSAEVALTMPIATAVPAAPQHVMAEPQGSFAVRLTWDSVARSAAGFEVRQGGKHVALLDPVAREFVHHGRLPGSTYNYSVVAFNARGQSVASAQTRVATPQRPPTTAAAKPSACVSRIAAPPKCSGAGNPDMQVLRGALQSVQDAPSAGDCMRRRLIGEYAGCTRELGVFSFQGEISVLASPDDKTASASSADGAWPLLRAIAGSGMQVGAQFETMAMQGGHYEIVDTHYACGEFASDPSDPKLSATECSMDAINTCAPPFARCQSEE